MSSEEDSEADTGAESSEEEEEEVEVPQIQLPSRATRGKRLEKLLEDEDSADEEFWNQDYFQETKADQEYNTESSEDSVADSDFSESEESSDEEGEDVDERSKRKTLKPPGAVKKQPQQTRRPPQTAHLPHAAQGAELEQPGSPMSPTTRAAVRAAQADALAEAAQFQAPTLRRSTLVRVEEAQKERQRTEQKKPRKAHARAEHRPLTQEELLAEAAQTELENSASVAALMAAEEESRERAAVRKAKYCGPLLRYHSLKVAGESVMLFEIANMLPPKEMQPQKAPPAPAKPQCVITGRPAKYRDPETGMPYADAEAFRELRRRASEGRPLHSKRTKRRRDGTGGWAHVASALRNDLPHSIMQVTAASEIATAAAPHGSFSAAAPQPPGAAAASHPQPAPPLAHPLSHPAQAAAPSTYPAQPHAQQQPASHPAPAPILPAHAGPSTVPAAAGLQGTLNEQVLPGAAAGALPSGGVQHAGEPVLSSAAGAAVEGEPAGANSKAFASGPGLSSILTPEQLAGSGRAGVQRYENEPQPMAIDIGAGVGGPVPAQ